jgi:hypothetical protein
MPMRDAQTQTTSLTFAQALSKNLITPTNKPGVPERKPSVITEKNKAKDPQQRLEKKYDVRSSNNDVKKVQNRDNYSHRHMQEYVKDLPKILVMNDSVFNDVNARRLGVSYGFDASQRKAFTADDISRVFEEEEKKSDRPVEGVVIHTGVNNLKSEDPEDVSKKLVSAVKCLAKKKPSMKIVLSSVAPTKVADLERKRRALHAYLSRELYDKHNVSIISHDHLQQSCLYDNIHPNRRGSSFLAKDIGRHVSNLFWSQASQKHSRSDYWVNHIQDY